MNLKIITATKILLEINDVAQVNIPGIDGVLGILPGHINLITSLQVGILEYKQKIDERKIVALKGGFAMVAEDNVLILADEADLAENLVREEIEESIYKAEHKIASANIEYSELIQLEKQLRYERIKHMSLNNT